LAGNSGKTPVKLPDFQKNVGKVTGYFRKSSPVASKFSKKSPATLSNFPEKPENPCEYFERAKGGEGCPPHPVCVQGGVLTHPNPGSIWSPIARFQIKKKPVSGSV
jgi:hypothetical protein